MIEIQSEPSILACPFCGAGGRVQSERCGFRVCCDNLECFVKGPWHTDDTELAAIAAWNDRQMPIIQLKEYDAGLLGDGGGGDVDWWQDYMRSELQRAYEFYSDQVADA